MRKNLIILIFFLSAIFLVLLFLNFNKSYLSNKSGKIDRVDKADNQKSPRKISRGPVQFFGLLGALGKVIFYEKSDSIVYEASFDGSGKKELARIPGASEIVFNPVKQSLIAAINQSGKTKKFYFDLGNSQKTEVNPNAENFVFSPDGTKLAYFSRGLGLDEKNISLSNPDGSDFKVLLKTRIKDLAIIWPEENLIVFYSKSQENPLVFSVSPETGKIQKLAPEKLASFLESSNKKNPLKDYSVFISQEDGKLYSLRE